MTFSNERLTALAEKANGKIIARWLDLCCIRIVSNTYRNQSSGLSSSIGSSKVSYEEVESQTLIFQVRNITTIVLLLMAMMA